MSQKRTAICDLASWQNFLMGTFPKAQLNSLGRRYKPFGITRHPSVGQMTTIKWANVKRFYVPHRVPFVIDSQSELPGRVPCIQLTNERNECSKEGLINWRALGLALSVVTPLLRRHRNVDRRNNIHRYLLRARRCWYRGQHLGDPCCEKIQGYEDPYELFAVEPGFIRSVGGQFLHIQDCLRPAFQPPVRNPRRRALQDPNLRQHGLDGFVCVRLPSCVRGGGTILRGCPSG